MSSYLKNLITEGNILKCTEMTVEGETFMKVELADLFQQEDVMERTEVTLDGETFLMTDEQIGNCFVEVENKEHLDQIRMILARAAGCPEPELYPWEVQESEDFREEQKRKADMEKVMHKLRQVVELQDRMEKGSQMINETQEKKDKVQKILDDLKNGKLPRIPYNKFTQLVDINRNLLERVKGLRAHWTRLKDECNSIVDGDKFVWVLFFQYKEGNFDLREEDMNKVYSLSDGKAIDEQLDYYLSQDEVMEGVLMNELRYTHLTR